MKKYPADYEEETPEAKEYALSNAREAITDTDNAVGMIYIAKSYVPDKRLRKAYKLMQEVVDLLQEFVDEG